MSIYRAIASGLIGACALTLTHQTARRMTPDAPRMDILGMRGLRRIWQQMNQKPPTGTTLYRSALVGDILSNTLYYSMIGVGRPKDAFWLGPALGITAGLGSIVLPGPLGLGKAPSTRTKATQAMTIAWYLIGGVAAALAYRLLTPKSAGDSATVGNHVYSSD